MVTGVAGERRARVTLLLVAAAPVLVFAGFVLAGGSVAPFLGFPCFVAAILCLKLVDGAADTYASARGTRVGTYTPFHPDFIAFQAERAHLNPRTAKAGIYLGVLLITGLLGVVFAHAIVVGVSDGIHALIRSVT